MNLRSVAVGSRETPRGGLGGWNVCLSLDRLHGEGLPGFWGRGGGCRGRGRTEQRSNRGPWERIRGR